ncbi:MAG: hypothetical protein H8D67_18915 [Deltaproteobacteria bacterium]|nr:hypothetical protein [Deltaproteobacteria bacterium]
MKTKYHKLLLRIPNELWDEIQAKANAEYKSCTAVIIEILRNAFPGVKVRGATNGRNKENLKNAEN